MPALAVLDSEALSCLAHPTERPVATKRAQAVLEAIERRGGLAIIPAPVLAEVARGPRRPAVDRWVNRLSVVSTDRAIATRAGGLLEGAGRTSSEAVDAFVVATAELVAPSVILTADTDDLAALASDVRAVRIQALP